MPCFTTTFRGDPSSTTVVASAQPPRSTTLSFACKPLFLSLPRLCRFFLLMALSHFFHDHRATEEAFVADIVASTQSPPLHSDLLLVSPNPLSNISLSKLSDFLPHALSLSLSEHLLLSHRTPLIFNCFIF